MAHRTSLPLHPTEFGETTKLSGSSSVKAKTKKSGKYKTSNLNVSTVKKDVDNQAQHEFRTTTSRSKRKGRGSKRRPKSTTRYTTKTSTKLSKDAPDTKVKYTTTVIKNGDVKKHKEISEKKYKRKRKRIVKRHKRFKE